MKSLLRTLTILALAAVPYLSPAQNAPEPAAPPAAVATPAAAAAPAAAPAPKYKDLAAFKESPGYSTFTVNNTWMMLSAALVFIMHLGFATVETGLTRSKNTVNILFKNTLIPCIGILTYAIVGFNLMYPGAEYAGKWFGFSGFGVSVTDDVAALTDVYNAGYTYWTDFLFQAMFAATAATIVSGAVAERVKLSSFLVFSTVFVAICYPMTGMWKWGNGWLNTMATPFYDFAGSSLVHSVGGWGALAGVMILGPRLGRYRDGKAMPMPGHSLPLATIGVFLLWLGWFGFNGGSVLSADPALVSLTLVTTCIAAAAGAVGAMVTSWITQKKPDLSMVLNGILAGLVGITAGADQMNMNSSIIIGLSSGIIVVLAVGIFDKLKLDDPVGALSVHLVCGIWGTLCVGIFGAKAGMDQFISQLIGVGAIGAFSFVFAYVLFQVIKAVMGLRVSPEEETEGLDLAEHGNEAYPEFK
jgi:Amt family ammonium transporter